MLATKRIECHTTAEAHRLAALLRATHNGLNIERLLAYRRAIEAGFYTDDLPAIMPAGN